MTATPWVDPFYVALCSGWLAEHRSALRLVSMERDESGRLLAFADLRSAGMYPGEQIVFRFTHDAASGEVTMKPLLTLYSEHHDPSKEQLSRMIQEAEAS